MEKIKSLPRKVLAAIAAGAAVLLLLSGFMIYKYFTETKPYKQAYTAMPKDGAYELAFLEDGSARITWPEADSADGYVVEVSDPEQGAENAAFTETVGEELSCVIPQYSDISSGTIKITSFAHYIVHKEQLTRYADSSAEFTGPYEKPEISDAAYAVDTETGIVTITYTLSSADGSIAKGGPQDAVLETADTEGGLTLDFSENGPYSPPEADADFRVGVYPRRTENGLILTGIPAEISLARNDFFGRSLNPVCTPNGDGRYTITWDETKGDAYIVQKYNRLTRKWETTGKIRLENERKFVTLDHSNEDLVLYRVAATGEDRLPGSEYAALSDAIPVYGTVDSLYCTIWPNKSLKVFADPGLSEDTGKTVPALKALCVLEDTGTSFRIRSADTAGYIDSNYCMINVAEYLGGLCIYDITNSYKSKYLVHEFVIDDVTGAVTTGYDNVRQDDETFLVPLLYPTAKSLESAAKSALLKGYKLKIYDAYRPNSATKDLYGKVSAILNNFLPETTYTGVPIEDLGLPEGYKWPSGISEEDAPAQEDPGTEQPAEQESPEGEDPSAQDTPDKPAEPELPRLTYNDILVTKKYSLTYFIANGKSKHNLGVAIDLTLADLATEEELTMQTSMHDLSGYSIRENNNENAKKLSGIMTDAGFSTLVSEWWHFNDMDAHDNLKPATMSGGVSAEGWMFDGTGWRYRRAKGSYYKNTTKSIGGVKYTFDKSGYTQLQ